MSGARASGVGEQHYSHRFRCIIALGGAPCRANSSRRIAIDVFTLWLEESAGAFTDPGKSSES